jgi:hypothetical protein
LISLISYQADECNIEKLFFSNKKRIILQPGANNKRGEKLFEKNCEAVIGA